MSKRRVLTIALVIIAVVGVVYESTMGALDQ